MIIPGVGAFNGGWLYKLGNCGHSIESASIFGRDDLEIGARIKFSMFDFCAPT